MSIILKWLLYPFPLDLQMYQYYIKVRVCYRFVLFMTCNNLMASFSICVRLFQQLSSHLMEKKQRQTNIQLHKG